MPTLLLKALAAAALAFAPVLATAGVLGTSVTGGLYFGANPINYFNSAQGYVPAGCQNSNAASATVVVVDPAAEFCFEDTANRDTAQFTDNTLTITDVVISPAANWRMTFAFAPNTVFNVTETSDMFVNGGINYTFADNVLTLTWAGTASSGLNLSAQYALQAVPPVGVPEPAPLALLALALLAIAAVRRRRKD